MLARLSAFVIWALVAATAVFWGLRLFVRPVTAPGYAVTVGEGDAVRADLGRLLGSTPANAPAIAAAPAASSRFKLLGIVAPRQARGADSAGGDLYNTHGGVADGVALIAVDGKLPKAFAVGAHVDGDLVLQSVSLRTARIAGEGAPAITLELPLPASPATGTLSGGAFGPAATMPVARPVPQVSAPQFQPQATPQPPVPGLPVTPSTSAQTEPATSPGAPVAFPPVQVQRRDENIQNQ